MLCECYRRPQCDKRGAKPQIASFFFNKKGSTPGMLGHGREVMAHLTDQVEQVSQAERAHKEERGRASLGERWGQTEIIPLDHK